MMGKVNEKVNECEFKEVKCNRIPLEEEGKIL